MEMSREIIHVFSYKSEDRFTFCSLRYFLLSLYWK